MYTVGRAEASKSPPHKEGGLRLEGDADLANSATAVAQ